MAIWNEDELTSILAEVARRSSVDEEFRALALASPRVAMQKVSSISIPADVNVTFLDNAGPIKFFPLPDPIPGLEELSEAELLAIAGGDFSITGGGGVGPNGPSYSGGGGWHR